MKLVKKIPIILFLISIIFIEIKYTFYKATETNAVSTSKIYKDGAVNQSFDDENFYRCVVDAYNQKNKTSHPYTYNLNDNELKTITNLGCTNNVVVSAKGLEKLTSLTSLSIYGNKLQMLDVSKNTELTYLSISRNKLKTLDLTKNTSLKEVNANDNQLTTLNLNGNTALTYLNIDDNQFTTLDVNNAPSLIELSVKRNKLTTLYVDEVLSLKRLHVESNQLTSLNVSNNQALTLLRAEQNQLTSLDVSKNTALTELCVSNNQLTRLDLSNNFALKNLFISNNLYGQNYYVYTGNDIIVNNNVKIPTQLNWPIPIWASSDTNIATVDENKLVTALKSGNVNIIGKSNDKYTITNKVNVVEITSDKYQINNEENYIYVGLDNNIDVIKENINISHEEINLNIDLENNKLQVKHNDYVLKEFKIIKLNSVDYDLTKKYIYTGLDSFDITKVNIINGTKIIQDSKLQIKYGTIILDEYALISVSTTGLKVLDNNIYISNKSTEEIEKNITITNGNFKLDDGKIIISIDAEIIDEIKILFIKLNNLKENNKLITISNNISYDVFTSNITKSDELTYKIFNNNEEMTSGEINEGMKLKIYYNNIEIDSFDITEEYYEFNKNIIVDEETKYLSNIKIGTSVNEMINNINTSGEISVVNYNKEIITGNSLIGTGSKVIIKLSNKTYEYTIIVPGDTTGDGKINVTDVSKLYQALRKKIQIEDYFRKSGNVVSTDNEIKITDVSKLYQFVRNKISSLED